VPLRFMGPVWIVFLSLLIATPWAIAQDGPNDGPESESPLDRVRRDADFGRLTAKEALLIEARLLFAPETLPADSPYAPLPGRPIIHGELTGFYKSIHRIYPELTREDKDWLRTLSPDLEAIISARETTNQGGTP
jgi:hypothetical protein